MTVVLNRRGPRVTRSVPDAEGRRELRKARGFRTGRPPVNCLGAPVPGGLLSHRAIPLS